MSLSIQITRDMTECDIAIEPFNNFPVIYVGRGTYSGVIELLSQALMTDGKNEVHLIYVGRYTSIGDNIQIICNMNHDYKSVYMGVISDYAIESEENNYRRKVGQNYRFLNEKGTVVIGNDVWIGNNVTIVANCVIGNGAVIGAGSIITKDIPPYTIWAGNPAVQIGTRFDCEINEKLNKISWWEFSKEVIAGIRDDMQGDVNDFVKKYFNSIGKIDRGNNKEKVYSCFIDWETEYSTFGAVIDQFSRSSVSDGGKLNIYYHSEIEAERILANDIIRMLSEINLDSNIGVMECDNNDDEKIISQSDFFVLGRDIRNILRISYALKHDVKIISAADNPILF